MKKEIAKRLSGARWSDGLSAGLQRKKENVQAQFVSLWITEYQKAGDNNCGIDDGSDQRRESLVVIWEVPREAPRVVCGSGKHQLEQHEYL
jgi:hypothetical protein